MTDLQTDLALYRRLLAQARPYWPNIGGMFLLSVLATPIALLAPYPIKLAVDSVVGQHPLPHVLRAVLPGFATGSTGGRLAVVAVLFVLIALLAQLQELSTSLLGTVTGEGLQLGFRSRLFRHVQRLSLAHHDSRGTADAVYRIQYDAPSIQWIAVYGVTPLLSAGLMLVAMVAVTARLDWELALVALAVTPALGALTWAYRRRLRSRWRETKDIESSALAVVQEVLTSLRVVKAFGQEEREHARFVERSGQGMRARIRLALIEGGFSLALAMTTAAGTAAVLYVGIRHVESGALTLGSLLLVLGYLTQLYAPMRTIGETVGTLQSALTSAERAFTLLDEVGEVEERPDARPLRRAAGAVAFQHVSFAYEPGRPVLHDVSFGVEPGERVGIVGPTGAGKSTLMSLLSRFYDPTDGRILLDGVDLRDYRLPDLRNQFAIVLQEPVLFSTSIAENIAYARPGASIGEIVAAAQAANAHDFVAGLPQGYDTMVGERGMRLSGGERQRISLARAFLRDAPILILDEPTSSIDTGTEAVIIDAIDRLMRGRTTFMIAHRLNTLRGCTVLLELEPGGSLASENGTAEKTGKKAKKKQRRAKGEKKDGKRRREALGVRAGA